MTAHDGLINWSEILRHNRLCGIGYEELWSFSDEKNGSAERATGSQVRAALAFHTANILIFDEFLFTRIEDTSQCGPLTNIISTTRHKQTLPQLEATTSTHSVECSRRREYDGAKLHQSAQMYVTLSSTSKRGELDHGAVASNLCTVSAFARRSFHPSYNTLGIFMLLLVSLAVRLGGVIALVYNQILWPVIFLAGEVGF